MYETCVQIILPKINFVNERSQRNLRNIRPAKYKRFTVIKSSLYISYRQNIWVRKSGPIAHVICYTKPLWSYDCDCDDSWLLLRDLVCLMEWEPFMTATVFNKDLMLEPASSELEQPSSVRELACSSSCTVPKLTRQIGGYHIDVLSSIPHMHHVIIFPLCNTCAVSLVFACFVPARIHY